MLEDDDADDICDVYFYVVTCNPNMYTQIEGSHELYAHMDM